jgi:hypothetical protein
MCGSGLVFSRKPSGTNGVRRRFAIFDPFENASEG